MTASAGTPRCGWPWSSCGSVHTLVCQRRRQVCPCGNGFRGELVTPYRDSAHPTVRDESREPSGTRRGTLVSFDPAARADRHSRRGRTPVPLGSRNLPALTGDSLQLKIRRDRTRSRGESLDGESRRRSGHESSVCPRASAGEPRRQIGPRLDGGWRTPGSPLGVERVSAAACSGARHTVAGNATRASRSAASHHRISLFRSCIRAQARTVAAPAATDVAELTPELVQTRFQTLLEQQQGRSVDEQLDRLDTASRQLSRLTSDRSLDELAGHFQNLAGLRGASDGACCRNNGRIR